MRLRRVLPTQVLNGVPALEQQAPLGEGDPRCVVFASSPGVSFRYRTCGTCFRYARADSPCHGACTLRVGIRRATIIVENRTVITVREGRSGSSTPV